MAGLFKNKMIKGELEKFEIPNLEQKLGIIQSWYDAYNTKELQKKNETQCEQAFNSDFFIKVLDYTPFPANIYSIQPKDNVETGGGQMPDATLGYFSKNDKRVIAVVEIKDANTSLDKSQQREGNLSPIQQAFKYKPQYKDCGFVIATNFFEIRIFRDNQLDYEKFTLKDLINPNDDYFNFKKFYFLFCANNFITEKGQTNTEKLLSAIRIEQEKITNKFYKEYKQLREQLIKDIIQNNEKIQRSNFYNHVVEKAQKIIDRIVFICFFEDAGLLPQGKLYEVVEYAQKGALDEPIWDTLKKFFKAVDEGSQKLGVPDGYNGELFKHDDEINNLKISNEICKHFVELSKFDFEEDLSVNILGHIFEQSIVDLERLKKYSESETPEVKKNETKRKKEGVYYTPEYIVDYIVKNSLVKFLEKMEQDVFAKHKLDSNRIKKDETYNKKMVEAYTEYRNLILNIKVLDPACGSGAFLVKVFDYLLAENKRISNIIGSLVGATSLWDTEDYVKSLLQNNIYGVDLNPESVEITKLSLWFKSAKKGQKLTTLKNNIKCGNSLIDNPEFAGERAFDWAKEFPEIITAGGFDVIVGNPPYVDSESMVKNDPLGRKFISQAYQSATGNWDLYIPFIEKSFELLKKNGYLSMIVPNKWLSMDYGKSLRKLIKNNVVLLADLSPVKVFEDANLSSIIFSIKKGSFDNFVVSKFTSSSEYSEESNKLEELSDDNWGDIFVENRGLLKDVENGSLPLGDFADVFGAFTTGEAYELIDLIKDLKINDNSDYLKLINTGTIEKYYTLWGIQKTAYLKNKYLYPVVQKEDFKKQFPKRFQKFDNVKIIVAGIRHFECILDDKNEFVAGKSTSVINNFKESVDPYTLICILNSKLITYYLKNKHSTSGMGGGINFSPDLIRSIPLKLDKINSDIKNNFKKLYYQLKEEITNKENQEKKLLQLLNFELHINELPKTIKDLTELDDSIGMYASKEIETDKKITAVNLILKEKDNLILISEKINRCLIEIDKIVYNLYGINSNSDLELINNFKSV